jgi:hypothetical protein
MGFSPSLIWMKTPSQLLFTKLVASFWILVLIKIGDKGLSWEWYFVTIILRMGFYSSLIWMEGTYHQKRRVYWPEDTLTESRSLFFTFHGFIIVALNWRQHSQLKTFLFYDLYNIKIIDLKGSDRSWFSLKSQLVNVVATRHSTLLRSDFQQMRLFPLPLPLKVNIKWQITGQCNIKIPWSPHLSTQ